MSISTSGGRNFLTNCTASAPFSDSPTTRNSFDRFRMALMPSRMILWSSTSRTSKGIADGNNCTPSRSAFECEPGLLGEQTGQGQGTSPPPGSPVVSHPNPHSGSSAHRNTNLGSTGPERRRGCFHRRLVERRGVFCGDLSRGRIRHRKPGILFGEPEQGVLQSDLIRWGSMQIAAYGTNLLDSLLQEFGD